MKTVAIIQARMNSERLRGKVLKKINGMAMIEIIYQRAKMANNVDEVVVATSEENDDDELYHYCVERHIKTFRGSLNNVLKRFYQCATKVNADLIIRLTGDNPFTDGEIIQCAVNEFVKRRVDYLKYGIDLPLGMGVEIFSYESLKRTYREATNSECLEHVTPYLYKNKKIFRCEEISHNALDNHSDIRLTVDTEADFEVAHSVFNKLAGIDFTYAQLLECLKENKYVMNLNRMIRQNQIMYRGEEQKMY